MLKTWITLFFILTMHMATAQTDTAFQSGASYRYCFRPDGPSCEKLLVRAINKTKKDLKIQAYVFTNRAIKNAIVRAKHRGVSVRIILDKVEQKKEYKTSVIPFFEEEGIPIFVDSEPTIAHNKIMIFDDSSFFTGSYNFTQAAEHKNAENGLLIEGDESLSKTYSNYWESRLKVSVKYP